jgi:hypothetical protein
MFMVRFQSNEDGRATGRIRVLDIEGTALEREVIGANCAEVADALALIAALAARPGASVDPPSEPVSSQETPRRPTQREGAAVKSPALEDRAPTWNLLVRGQASVRTQIMPVSLYGAGAGFELAREGSSVWQPAAGVVVEGTLTATANTESIAPNTEMAAQLTVAHLFASPARLRAGAVELRPYFSLDAGRLALEGKGSGLARDTQNRKLWIATALFAQTDIQLGAGWRAGASLGVEVRPFLYQFQYSELDVYRVGDVGLIAGLSVAYQFLPSR